MFSILFDEGVGRLSMIMRPHLCGIVNTDSVLELEVKVSDDWAEEMKGAVQSGVRDYMKFYLLHCWLDILGSNEAMANESRCSEAADAIQAALCYRRSPKRSTTSIIHNS